MITLAAWIIVGVFALFVWNLIGESGRALVAGVIGFAILGLFILLGSAMKAHAFDWGGLASDPLWNQSMQLLQQGAPGYQAPNSTYRPPTLIYRNGAYQGNVQRFGNGYLYNDTRGGGSYVQPLGSSTLHITDW